MATPFALYTVARHLVAFIVLLPLTRRELQKHPVVSLNQASALLYVSYLVLIWLDIPCTHVSRPVVKPLPNHARWDMNRLKALLKASTTMTVFTLLGALILHTLAVLFGSHLTDLIWETWSAATFISVLLVPPTFLAFPPSSHAYLRIFSENKLETLQEREAHHAALGTLFGAWLGAITLPLDWHQPWQTWPVPCVWGAWLGNVVASAVGCMTSDRPQLKKKL